MVDTIYCGLAKKDCYFKERMYEMEKQIEKMKCCGNCKNIRTQKCAECVLARKYENWELKESEE